MKGILLDRARVAMRRISTLVSPKLISRHWFAPVSHSLEPRLSRLAGDGLSQTYSWARAFPSTFIEALAE